MSPDEARLITHLAKLAYWSTLVGSPAPSVEAVGRRMKDVRVGDLVFEGSTYLRDPWDPSALGWLRSIEQEPVDIGWDEADERRPVPTETVYYVDPLTGGELARWVDADFVALPAKTLHVSHPENF